MSTKEQILNYLEQGHTLTALKALDLFGTMRLAAYVKFLREDGIDITTNIITNGSKTFAEYSLGKQNDTEASTGDC